MTMGAASEYDLISKAAELALQQAANIEREVEKRLQTHADTPSVDALRTLNMLRAIIAIGSFSIFESLLQQIEGWTKPFEQLEAVLRARGEDELADRFGDYRGAINVLKHGQGRSYDALLKRVQHLEFSLKAREQVYFQEGDVAEGLRLIDVDEQFVRRCYEIIQEIVEKLRAASNA